MRLESDRLILRTANTRMADEILSYKIRNKDYFAPWQDKCEDDCYTRRYQKWVIGNEKKLFSEWRSIDLWIYEREEKSLIGKISAFGILMGNASGCVIGYSLDEAHVGRGYMSEAIRCFEAFLFRELNLHRIEIDIVPRNERSVAVALRNGYTYEGIACKLMRINGVWEDHARYAKINPDYIDC